MWDTSHANLSQLITRYNVSIPCSRCFPEEDNEGDPDRYHQQRTCYDCLTYYCGRCDVLLHNKWLRCEDGVPGAEPDKDYPCILHCNHCKNATCLNCATFQKCANCSMIYAPCDGCRSSICNQPEVSSAWHARLCVKNVTI